MSTASTRPPDGALLATLGEVEQLDDVITGLGESLPPRLRELARLAHDVTRSLTEGMLEPADRDRIRRRSARLRRRRRAQRLLSAGLWPGALAIGGGAAVGIAVLLAHRGRSLPPT